MLVGNEGAILGRVGNRPASELEPVFLERARGQVPLKPGFGLQVDLLVGHFAFPACRVEAQRDRGRLRLAFRRYSLRPRVCVFRLGEIASRRFPAYTWNDIRGCCILAGVGERGIIDGGRRCGVLGGAGGQGVAGGVGVSAKGYGALGDVGKRGVLGDVGDVGGGIGKRRFLRSIGR